MASPEAYNELGKWLFSHRFSSKPAKIVSKFGQIVGYLAACAGIMLGVIEYFGDDEITWIYLLIGVLGILFMIGMHWIALKMDRKVRGKNE